MNKKKMGESYIQLCYPAGTDFDNQKTKIENQTLSISFFFYYSICIYVFILLFMISSVDSRNVFNFRWKYIFDYLRNIYFDLSNNNYSY